MTVKKPAGWFLNMFQVFPSVFDHSRPLAGVWDEKNVSRKSVLWSVSLIFAHFCSFLLLEPIFDCTKASGVVPEHVRGVSECF